MSGAAAPARCLHPPLPSRNARRCQRLGCETLGLASWLFNVWPRNTSVSEPSKGVLPEPTTAGSVQPVSW